MSIIHSLKCLICCLTIGSTVTGCDWISRVNTTADGANGVPSEGNWGANSITLSEDGRYAVFASADANLVPGDTNGYQDVFRKDTRTGAIIRVNVASDGTQANGVGVRPTVSADGRYVLFSSRATNLVSNDYNGVQDVFLHDTLTGITTRESVATDGSEGSEDSDSHYQQGLSADGRWIAFHSESPELAPLEFDDLRDRVFLRDRVSGSTIALGLNGADTEAPIVPPGANVIDSYTFVSGGKMSSDGRYILVNAGAVKVIATGGYPMTANINNYQQYVYDHQAQEMTSINSMVADGELPEEAYHTTFTLSPDGKFLLLSILHLEPSRVLGLLSVQTGTIEIVSQVPPGTTYNTSSDPIISADNRYVMFSGRNETGFDQAYVRDTHQNKTSLVGASAAGTPGSTPQISYSFSADSRYTGFCTYSSDTIIPGNVPSTNSCYIRSFPGLAISAVTPSHLPIGAVSQVTITGDNFLTGATPRIEGVDISNIVNVDENTITAEIHVPPHASPGNQSLQVILVGTGPGAVAGSTAACPDCITFF